MFGEELRHQPYERSSVGDEDRLFSDNVNSAHETQHTGEAVDIEQRL